jgi:hypothetical protein
MAGILNANAAQSFFPGSLFANNEPGVWYDPSDMATLFQDAAGTTPVTAVEQPVGLVLDKSRQQTFETRRNIVNYSERFDNAYWSVSGVAKTANAATDPLGNTTADRILGGGSNCFMRPSGVGMNVTEQYTFSCYCKSDAGRWITLRNLAIPSEPFAWFDVIDGIVGTVQSGITAAILSVGGGWFRCSVTGTTKTSFGATFDSAEISPRNGDNVNTADASSSFYVWGAQVELGSSATDYQATTTLPTSWAGNHASQSTSTARPVLSARINLLANTDTLATQSVTTVATNYTLRFEGAGTITLSGTATGTFSAGTHTVTCTAGTLTLTVSGAVNNADLRVANDGVGLPVYQRVGAGTAGTSSASGSADYDTAGFPRYLRFDGTDDFLVTGTITPGVDKAQVFAGVRKLSDAATGFVLESSVNINSNNGSINFRAPETVGTSQNYRWISKGTSLGDAPSATGSYPAPTTNVLCGIGDISGDLATLRVNSTQVAQSTADQGTGNYLAYPLYIGRRGGTSLPFNGRIYSLAVRFGANLTDAQIAQTETWVNSKTRAF